MYRAIMPNVENPTERTLAGLAINDPMAIEELFTSEKVRFDKQLAAKHPDEVNYTLMKNAWLGRKAGVLTLITENWLKSAPPALKPIVGQSLNQLKRHIEESLETFRVAAEKASEEVASNRDRVDLSLPGVLRPVGSHHLIRQVFQEIEDIFFSIGFSVVEGPEIETPYYNFEALNIPEFHPVRDDMDTFYLELPKGAPTPLLLRTHTSPMQIRTM